MAALGVFLLAIPPHTAHAICRVVESATAAPVAFDPTTSALWVLVPDAIIGWECPGGEGPPDAGPAEVDAGALDLDADELPDAGEPLDAGEADDAGEPLDAGETPDTGEELDPGEALDAGMGDAGMGDAGMGDAGATAPDGTPLCEGGERATPVRASVVSLVVQPHLLAGGGTSALVMPVPAHPRVVPATTQIFTHVRSASSSAVHERVEVIEDPALGYQCTDPHYSAEAEPSSDPTTMLAEAAATVLLSPLGLLGCAANDSFYATDIGPVRTGTYRPDGGDGSVHFEEIPTIDDYEVTVLSATDGSTLSAWLDDNGFDHSTLDDQVFADYVGEDHWFVALKVTPEPGTGRRDLAPLVVSWLGTEIPVTHRLQHDPEGGILVTDTWVLAPDRMDAADGSAVTESADPLLVVPSTLRGFGLGNGWLTHLRISRNQREDVPDSRLVAVPNEPIDGSLERTTRVRIPLACCPGGAVAGPPRVHTFERTFAVNESPPVPEEWLRSSYAATDPVCTGYSGGSWSGGSWSSGGGCSGSVAPDAGSTVGSGPPAGSSTSPSRPLRGCSVPGRSGGVFFAWVPVALAVLWVAGRGRRR